mmetsp:Transcript_1035/g.1863  ORF Transcript_1035/g.1863 Transcript_1035/m.1863 type:complete len:155 (+) Transcript_1035:1-465(+)
MNSKNMKRRVVAVANGEAAARCPSTTSFVPSVVQFITDCMTHDPARRPRAGDLLAHDFFTLHAKTSAAGAVIAGREAPASCSCHNSHSPPRGDASRLCEAKQAAECSASNKLKSTPDHHAGPEGVDSSAIPSCVIGPGGAQPASVTSVVWPACR